MQTTKSLLVRFFNVALFSLFSISPASTFAQDTLDQRNTVLDIDALYQPVASQQIHGETAINLLEELQTKHYSAVEIDDNFSSAAFDSFLDTLDGSHLYFLKDILLKFEELLQKQM